MTEKINKKILEKVLKRFKKVVHNNSPKKALTCTKFKGDGKVLSISGTNGRTALVEEMECEFTGTFCVNLKIMLNMLKPIKAEGIAFETIQDPESSERLKVSAPDGSAYILDTFPADDFPAIEGDEDSRMNFHISSATLARALKKCSPFVCEDDTRPYIYGINVKAYMDNTIRLEATNGHRLIVESSIPAKVDRHSTTLLHAEAVPVMIEVVRKQEGEAVLSESESHIFCKAGSSRVAIKKAGFEFPPVDGLIPRSPMLACRFNREQMLEAVKQAGAMTTNDSSERVMFHIAGDGVKVKIELPSSGGSYEKVVECRANGRMRLAFNHRYVIDALEKLEADSVEFGITDGVTGMVMSEGHTVMLIMPVRLGGEDKPVIDEPIESIATKESATEQKSAA